MRKKMKDSYRWLSWLTDIGGIKDTITDIYGIGHDRQPLLNKKQIGHELDINLNHAWFVNELSKKLAKHPGNWMEYPFYGERIFNGNPLVGFVQGNDPIFKRYKDKEVIGPHHLTPEEAMAWQAKRNGVQPPASDEISVVSFVLPLSRATEQENETRKNWFAERWAHTRVIGERFILILEREIVAYFMNQGILAVAPDATPLLVRKSYPHSGWGSPWSQRHIGYAAGLGTFGFHDFLITEKGCLHCMGSIVIKLPIETMHTRPEDIHRDCLHFQGKKCLRCVSRCPANALSKDKGHNKDKCYKRLNQSLFYCNWKYHIFGYGCGLCSTNVPCARGIPSKNSLCESARWPTLQSCHKAR
jgi:epoxyqueuosine reductase